MKAAKKNLESSLHLDSNHSDRSTIESVTDTGNSIHEQVSAPDVNAAMNITDSLLEFNENAVREMFEESRFIVQSSVEKLAFRKSRQKEPNGLHERIVFEAGDENSIWRRSRVYGLRWVDAVQNSNGKLIEQSTLFRHSFRDHGAMLWR